MSNFLYAEKNHFPAPVFLKFRGLETRFFPIDTLGTQISEFFLNFQAKWALIMIFFRIDPAEGS